MNRQTVQSSNVKSVGYCPDTKRLHVEFHNGGVYEYSDVPPQTHQKLMSADSIGVHLHQHIKGKFDFKKL